MTNQLYPVLFLTFFSAFGLFSCQNFSAESKFSDECQIISDSLRTIYAPDKRVALFSPTFHKSTSSGCFVLNGVTNLPQTASILRSELQRRGYCFQDSLLVLPPPDLGADTFGIVKVSVANLRSQPKHSGELATQALLGMPLRVYDRNDGWFLVQTPDRYLAWLEGGAFERTDVTTLEKYYSENLAVVHRQLVPLQEGPGRGAIIRDLTVGNLIQLGERNGEFQEVILPDGAIGFMQASDATPFEVYKEVQTDLQLPRLVQHFYGIPYLWGGTSNKGVDCSGFTKMTYWLNGFVIPRDASQQVHAGIEVMLDEELTELEEGDLLFFGNLREDGSQRITHVGIYLGNGRFVHSGADNGFVKEESLIPGTPDYAPHRRESLLRAKRLAIQSPGVVPIQDVLPL